MTQFNQQQSLMNYENAVNFLQQSDSVMAGLIVQVGLCQLNNSQQNGDLFSSLARAIIHQQLSTKVAATIHRRFLDLYWESAFPQAQEVLNTPDTVLRSVGLSRPKIRYLKDLASQVLAGLPNIGQLETMDDEAIIQTLTQVKGVGRWTVQMLLIFRLHRLDVLPTEDLGIRAAIRKLYGLNELPDKQTVINLGQKWQPYRSIASWYLWRGLEFS